MTQVAIVILNYNGEKFLRDFLPGVIKNSEGARIIVADNASTDGSVNLLTTQFPSVEIIKLDKNYGFCGGYNKALKQVDADVYVLLNSDVEVTSGWLTPIISLMDKDASIAAVQPKILAYHNKDTFEYAGAGGGFIDSLGYPFCRGRLFNYTEIDNGQYNDTREVFWASGACLFIRSTVYHQFNGLDEDFFAHMEEIDLCWKINRTTSKVFYCGSSTVYHVGAGTLSYDSPRKTYLNFRNGLSLLYKHFDPIELIVKLPVRILLDWIAAAQFLLKGKASNARSVLKAHIDFLKNLSSNTLKRKSIRGLFPHYSRKNIHKGLILINYFLLGQKRINVD